MKTATFTLLHLLVNILFLLFFQAMLVFSPSKVGLFYAEILNGVQHVPPILWLAVFTMVVTLIIGGIIVFADECGYNGGSWGLVFSMVLVTTIVNWVAFVVFALLGFFISEFARGFLSIQL